jgi:hypothetical protein
VQRSVAAELPTLLVVVLPGNPVPLALKSAESDSLN